ncbi:MAG: histidinol dehydrogenase, partial [Thaumarchaeota archaeon]|nr:histidinol dehydrogenase [Nitrososphaerota archaeon]
GKMSQAVNLKRYSLTSENVATLAKSLRKSSSLTKNIERVKAIVDDVRQRGDAALVEYAKKFDNIDIEPSEFRVKTNEIKRAYSKVSNEEVRALKNLKKRVAKLDSILLKQLRSVRMQDDGLAISLKVSALESVGCYVPGGKAIYPTSLVMCCVPAKIAGVERVVVCSPCSQSKEIAPILLVAADICGVGEIYKLGGAQAIAALAYGTRTIEPVNKIVGPGSIYVAQAKILVSNDVAIDNPAGPSEILIIADESADARDVARDLISQAEHGQDSVSGLVSTSKTLIDKVASEVRSMLKDVHRKEMVEKSIAENAFMLECDSLQTATEFANAFAPEHLEIITKNATAVAKKINSSGVVLLGKYTPVASSDYGLGTNHVLPTGGSAATSSGLSVLDFVKRTYVAQATKSSLAKLAKDMGVLAKAEGLINHYRAIEERLN